MQIIIVKSEDFVVVCIVLLGKKFLAFMDKRGWATTRFFAQINEWSRRLKTLEHGWEFLLIICLERALFLCDAKRFYKGISKSVFTKRTI